MIAFNRTESRVCRVGVIALVGWFCAGVAAVSVAEAAPHHRVVTTMSAPDTYGRIGTTTTVAEVFPDGSNAARNEKLTVTTTRQYAAVDLASKWAQQQQVICSTESVSQTSALVSSSLWTNAQHLSASRYDALGRVVVQVAEPSAADCANAALAQPAGRLVTTQSYRAFGSPWETKIVAGAGLPSATLPRTVSSVAYDATGTYANSAQNALGHSVVVIADLATGTVTSQTDANGLTDTFQYDNFGRATITDDAEGLRSTTTYNWCDASCPTYAVFYITVQKTVRATGQQAAPTTIQYMDQLNRVLRKKVQAPASDGRWIIAEDNVYNDKGQLSQQAKPYFAGDATIYWTSFQYDALGRLQKATAPDGAVTKVAYDILQTTTTNAKNQVKIEQTGLAGKPTRITDNHNSTMLYAYDGVGNLLSTTNPYGAVRTYVYDAWGNKTQDADPDLGRWSYTYDALGNVLTQTDAKNQVTVFAYDKLGRLLTRTEPDMNSAWVWDTATKGVGQLARLTGNNGFERNYYYDSFGRPAQASTSKTIDPNALATDPDFAHSTSYDSAGRPEAMTYPTGFGYKNVYDSNGYLSEVRNKDSNALYWQANTRDAEGRVTRETLGNGLTTARRYKADTGYLDTVQTGTLSGATLSASVQNDTYSFDALGNLATRSQYFGSTSLTENFAYDGLNRLTNATVLGGSTKTASYNAIGNITSRSDVGSYVYSGCGGAHRVCYIGFSPLISYDANGNILSGNGRSLSWTSYNYPVQITQGTSSESFLYTPERERVRRISIEGGQTTTTVYLNPRIDLGGTFEKTYKPDGTVEYTHHVYAGDQVIGSVITASAAATQTRYFHADHLGSLMAVTDAAGAVVERLSYDAWGKRRSPDSRDDTCNVLSGESSEHGFTLHEHLDSVDLVHMNGRVYDPLIGRFLSADPNVFYPDDLQDFNVYSYVHNNPLSETDPSGFVPVLFLCDFPLCNSSNPPEQFSLSNNGSYTSPVVALEQQFAQNAGVIQIPNSLYSSGISISYGVNSVGVVGSTQTTGTGSGGSSSSGTSAANCYSSASFCSPSVVSEGPSLLEELLAFGSGATAAPSAPESDVPEITRKPSPRVEPSFLHSAMNATMNFVEEAARQWLSPFPVAGFGFKVAGGLLVGVRGAVVAKTEANAAREAAKEQFRKEAAGLETKVIRSGRDGTGKIVGVGTTTRQGPTYRPKDDGSYSVGRPGKVQHFRPDGQGGYTVDQP